MRKITDEKKRIGLKIRTLRMGLGYTQEQLSKKIQIGRTAISQIENGLTYPCLLSGIRIAKALNITAEQLVKDPIDPFTTLGKLIGSVSRDDFKEHL